MKRSRDSRDERVNRRVVSGDEYLRNQRSKGDKLAIKIPAGVSQFVPKGGNVYSILVIPYEVSKKSKHRHPYVKPGYRAPERSYSAHMRIGPNQVGRMCPGMFNKPCPMCEEVREMGYVPTTDQASMEKKRNLLNKPRQVYNVVEIGQEEKGVQLMDQSFRLFGEELKKAIEFEKKVNPKLGARYNLYYDPDRPYILTFNAVESNLLYKFVTCESFKFRRYDKPLSDEWLQKAVNLDDLIEETSYDDLRALYAADPEEGDAPDGKGHRRDEDEEDDEDDEEDESDDEDEDEDDDDRPARKNKGKKSSSRRDDDEDEEDEEEESDDEDDDDEDEEDDDRDWSKKMKKGGGKAKKVKKKRRRFPD